MGMPRFSVRRRSGLAAWMATALLAAIAVVMAPPSAAQADAGGKVQWGKVCIPGINQCFAGGLLRVYVYGRGDQIHAMRGEFAAVPTLSNWQFKYELRDTAGDQTVVYSQFNGKKHATTNVSGTTEWVPDGYPARTGQACISIWSNNVRLATKCLSITPSNVVLRSSGGNASKCLDVDINGGGRDGSKVQLWRCNSTAQQGWRLDAGGEIRSVRYPDKCLDADTNGNGADGSVVQIYGCNGQGQQKWRVGANGWIINDRYNKCLDADLNRITSDGAKVQIWGCNGQAQQNWR